jgi:hypothetical protein
VAQLLGNNQMFIYALKTQGSSPSKNPIDSALPEKSKGPDVHQHSAETAFQNHRVSFNTVGLQPRVAPFSLDNFQPSSWVPISGRAPSLEVLKFQKEMTDKAIANHSQLMNMHKEALPNYEEGTSEHGKILSDVESQENYIKKLTEKSIKLATQIDNFES